MHHAVPFVQHPAEQARRVPKPDVPMKPDAQPPSPAERCSQCGAPFVCGYAAGLRECWCSGFPKLPAGDIVAGRGCLCPDCLRAKQASQTPPAA